jgi:hypothetical protein
MVVGQQTGNWNFASKLARDNVDGVNTRLERKVLQATYER